MQSLSYDYIIIGAGLSGLQLAFAFYKDPYFQNKKIAIIEPKQKNLNDKTWSFWEKGSGNWDHIVAKTWSSGEFYGAKSKKTFNLNPYLYKSIYSLDFYEHIIPQLKQSKNITYIQDEVLSLTAEEKVTVVCKTKTLKAQQVFHSRIPQAFIDDNKAIKLLQHFKGYVIECKEEVFDPEVFTMMDYRLTYRNTTSFTYILPYTANKALVEYTFFSNNLVENSVYEEQLSSYISKYITNNYTITETEQGIIPMTTYNFSRHNSSLITMIGTAGGWVKGSTGYSFKHTEHKVAKIIDNIKCNRPISSELYSKKYQFYDSIFLQVLKEHNYYGPKLFEDFYRTNQIESALKFLDEQSSFKEELSIMWRLKSMKFVKAFFKTLF